ncbi:MAG: hypothetical protein ABIZ80_17445 [Bryobacteraceae bacterium]
MTAIPLRFLVAPILAAASLAQVKTSRFHDRDAWVVEGPKLRVTMLQSGGHIAEVSLKDAGSVNPLWIQKRPTIDIEQYVASKHEKLYGGNRASRLMSGLAGHNLCFPYWGGPTPAEAKAGMAGHGETNVLRWKQAKAPAEGFTTTVDLPESRTRLTRTLRVDGQVVWFEETGENLSAWDRAIGWCQHVTIGPPFLEKGVTIVDASVTRGRFRGDTSGKEFVWPAGEEGGKRIDLRTVRNLPESGFVNNFMVNPSRKLAFFGAFNPKYKLLFGYIFPRAEFAWLNVWEANNADMFTRGLEFSNTPVDGTAKALMEQPKLFGLPTFDWLEGKSRITKRYAAFSVRVPDGYKGTADVRLRERKLEIVEQGTGKILSLDVQSSREWSAYLSN